MSIIETESIKETWRYIMAEFTLVERTIKMEEKMNSVDEKLTDIKAKIDTIFNKFEKLDSKYASKMYEKALIWFIGIVGSFVIIYVLTKVIGA